MPLNAIRGNFNTRWIFLEDPINQNSTFWRCADGLQNFLLSFFVENPKKLLRASMKSLTNSENPFSKLNSGSFPIAACVSPKSGHEWTHEKIDQGYRRKAGTKIRCGVWYFFSICKCFQRSKRNLYIYFSLEQAINFKTICTSEESTNVSI